MSYCFYYNTHFVETVVNAGTTLQLNTTNDTNISTLTPYYFKRVAEISDVTTAPIPVTVGVNDSTKIILMAIDALKDEDFPYFNPSERAYKWVFAHLHHD